MTPKGYLTSQDLDDIKKEIEKDPKVKIDWTFSDDEKKNKPVDYIDINWFKETKIEDHEKGLIYFLYSVKNKSKNKIFAEVKVSFESIAYLGMSGPLLIDWVEIKRVKHPEFYAVKTAEQLRIVTFPIRLEKITNEGELFRCKNNLNYIYPKSTHYYMVRFKPTRYFPISEAHTTFQCRGTFI
jgi:hypothetical protein